MVLTKAGIVAGSARHDRWLGSQRRHLLGAIDRLFDFILFCHHDVILSKNLALTFALTDLY